MNRIARMCLSALLFIAAYASAPPAYASGPIYESRSSGLFAFSGDDKLVRVAVVFVKPDDAEVETVVNFIEADGTILKKHRAFLRDGRPIVVELTRPDVEGRQNVLLRVQVIHKLPGERPVPYPIMVSIQPVSSSGTGRFVIEWPSGWCATPSTGGSTTQGAHANCGEVPPVEFYEAQAR